MRPEKYEYRDRAATLYATDDCEIDDTAEVSVNEDGAWVAAWAWVQDADIVKEEPAS